MKKILLIAFIFYNFSCECFASERKKIGDYLLHIDDSVCHSAIVKINFFEQEKEEKEIYKSVLEIANKLYKEQYEYILFSKNIQVSGYVYDFVYKGISDSKYYDAYNYYHVSVCHDYSYKLFDYNWAYNDYYRKCQFDNDRKLGFSLRCDDLQKVDSNAKKEIFCRLSTQSSYVKKDNNSSEYALASFHLAPSVFSILSKVREIPALYKTLITLPFFEKIFSKDDLGSINDECSIDCENGSINIGFSDISGAVCSANKSINDFLTDVANASIITDVNILNENEKSLLKDIMSVCSNSLSFKDCLAAAITVIPNIKDLYEPDNAVTKPDDEFIDSTVKEKDKIFPDFDLDLEKDKPILPDLDKDTDKNEGSLPVPVPLPDKDKEKDEDYKIPPLVLPGEEGTDYIKNDDGSITVPNPYPEKKDDKDNTKKPKPDLDTNPQPQPNPNPNPDKGGETIIITKPSPQPNPFPQPQPQPKPGDEIIVLPPKHEITTPNPVGNFNIKVWFDELKIRINNTVSLDDNINFTDDLKLDDDSEYNKIFNLANSIENLLPFERYFNITYEALSDIQKFSDSILNLKLQDTGDYNIITSCPYEYNFTLSKDFSVNGSFNVCDTFKPAYPYSEFILKSIFLYLGFISVYKLMIKVFKF